MTTLVKITGATATPQVQADQPAEGLREALSKIDDAIATLTERQERQRPGLERAYAILERLAATPAAKPEAGLDVERYHFARYGARNVKVHDICGCNAIAAAYAESAREESKP